MLTILWWPMLAEEWVDTLVTMDTSLIRALKLPPRADTDWPTHRWVQWDIIHISLIADLRGAGQWLHQWSPDTSNPHPPLTCCWATLALVLSPVWWGLLLLRDQELTLATVVSYPCSHCHQCSSSIRPWLQQQDGLFQHLAPTETPTKTPVMFRLAHTFHGFVTLPRVLSCFE